MNHMMVFCAAALRLLLSTPVAAGGRQPFDTFDPEPIVADCWSASEDLRGAGSVAAYGDGLDITQACMEEAVLTQIDEWLLPEFTEGAREHLHALRDLHADLYFRIYSHNRYCSRSCGLLPGMRYIHHYIYLLETILRDIAEEKAFRNADQPSGFPE